MQEHVSLAEPLGQVPDCKIGGMQLYRLFGALAAANTCASCRFKRSISFHGRSSIIQYTNGPFGLSGSCIASVHIPSMGARVPGGPG